jgi:hypothetical protein
MIRKFILFKQNQEIDMKNFAPGVYFLKPEEGGVYKIIKRNN